MVSTPENPPLLPKLSSWQLALLACSSGLSVANVYYAQPLLDALALTFAITPASAGSMIFATQVGCIAALLVLVPLGDAGDRRNLMRWQLLGLIAALLLTAVASSPLMLLLAMMLTGLLGTAMTQGMIAYAASAASESNRGRVVGIVSGGVVVGLLLARTFAGLVADVSSWRGVYLVSALMMTLLAAFIWRNLPQLPRSDSGNGWQMMQSLWQTLLRNPVLQLRGMLALLMFASFNIFWNALVLLLRDPPWQLSHGQIGALGLAGVIGVLTASRAGRWADRGLAQRTSGVALSLLLLSWLPLWLGAGSLWWLISGILLLDAAGQALHVTSQQLIFASQPDAGGRLIAGYMLFYSVGSGLGALLSTQAYVLGGWSAVCLCGAAVSLLALVIWSYYVMKRGQQ